MLDLLQEITEANPCFHDASHLMRFPYIFLTSHSVVQPQETTWRCTAHKQEIHRSQPPTCHTCSGQNRSIQKMVALCPRWQILATFNFKPRQILDIKSTCPPPPLHLPLQSVDGGGGAVHKCC